MQLFIYFIEIILLNLISIAVLNYDNIKTPPQKKKKIKNPQNTENPITPKSEINRISITIYWGRFLFFKPINLRATLIMINIGMSYYVKEEAFNFTSREKV